mmetsp:Transcript_12941/g.40834  ORF Transcript_12941/g.40834 Transcript_12941/m.40834 type:complete len:197 (-) Transcript_12941:34-624(-)
MRRQAAALLGQVASVGDGVVVDALLEVLRHAADSQTRRSAMISLRDIASARDPRVVAALVAHMRAGEEGDVRETAAMLLGEVAGRGNETARAALVDRMEDGDIKVRKLVVRALGRVLTTREKRVFDRIVALLAEEAMHESARHALQLLYGEDPWRGRSGEESPIRKLAAKIKGRMQLLKEITARNAKAEAKRAAVP